MLDTVGTPTTNGAARDKATALIHALCVMLATVSDFDDDAELSRFAVKLARDIREHVANGRRQWHALEGRKPS